MKRIVCGLVAVVLLFTLVGCNDVQVIYSDVIENPTTVAGVQTTTAKTPKTTATTTRKTTKKQSVTVAATEKSTTPKTTLSSQTTEKTVKRGTKVFETKNIVRITLYSFYGTGIGSDVPDEHMPAFTSWLDSFVVGDIYPTHDGDRPHPLPGTNTWYVEIEYADGKIIKQGMDTIHIDGKVYDLEKDKEPDSFMEIMSKVRLE